MRLSFHKSMQTHISNLTKAELLANALDENGVDTVVFWSGSGDSSNLERLEGVPGFRGKGTRLKRKQLSNFYEIPCIVNATTFPSSEHAFHALKASYFGREKLSKEFAVGGKYGKMKPSAIKKFTGKKHIIATPEMLAKWQDVGSRDALMRAVRAKFIQQSDMLAVLKETKNARIVHMMTQRFKPSKFQRWEFLEKLRDTH